MTVGCTVVYCDKCRKIGSHAAYDDVESVTDDAEHKGWQLSHDSPAGEKPMDLCPECRTK